mmetsp:Transcript_6687/g.20848  ORF Transcript_6687/g.20848 Transcript_6687/m.20848 type:complete len:206 (-) Transcript_6687:82-699(-)
MRERRSSCCESARSNLSASLAQARSTCATTRRSAAPSICVPIVARCSMFRSSDCCTSHGFCNNSKLRCAGRHANTSDATLQACLSPRNDSMRSLSAAASPKQLAIVTSKRSFVAVSTPRTVRAYSNVPDACAKYSSTFRALDTTATPSTLSVNCTSISHFASTLSAAFDGTSRVPLVNRYVVVSFAKSLSKLSSSPSLQLHDAFI